MKVWVVEWAARGSAFWEPRGAYLHRFDAYHEMNEIKEAEPGRWRVRKYVPAVVR